MKRWVTSFFALLTVLGLLTSLVVLTSGQPVAVAVLSALAGALTLAGLGWGARELVKEHQTLVADLDQLTLLSKREDLSTAQRRELMYAVRMPSSTNLDVLYLREGMRRSILEHAVDNLRYPAILAVIGVLSATVASVWSVWV